MGHHMMDSGQSQKEAWALMTLIFNVKLSTNIATWNVWSLNKCDSMDQVIEEMKNYKVNILRICGMRQTGQDKIIREVMIIIYSDNDNHNTHGVGFLLDAKAAKQWLAGNQLMNTY